jgi:BASS family bile acid:Na+ symporter
MNRARRPADLIAQALLPLALAAIALALIVPAKSAAGDGDAVLASLVLLTALGIAPHQLWGLRFRWQQMLLLSVAPFAVLVPLAWLLSRLFESPVREGILTLGLSSTEVAAVGLVALVGGDAALALGALVGSLVVAATAGPLLVGMLAGAGAHASPWSLFGRFALVVLAPLVVGVALRLVWPRLRRGESWFAAGSTLAVVVLIYLALSGTSAGGELLAAVAGSAAFLLCSGLLGAAAARCVARDLRTAVGFAVTLRDFAVAATLATSAFGARAGTVAGVYGVLMLVTGAIATAVVRPRLPPPDSGLQRTQ